MQQGRKIIVPQVFWYSNFRGPTIDVSEFRVEVDGYFKKDIVVSLANGNIIRVTSKNKIMDVQIRHHALDSMKVTYLNPDSSTKVLAKTACSPSDPGFMVDSIFVSHSSRISVSLKKK